MDMMGEIMISDREVMEVLSTKATDLSNWLNENFDPYTSIIITPEEVKIVKAVNGIPIPRNQED